MTVVHYVEIFQHGDFFEHEVQKIEAREHELVKMPEQGYAYRFFDRYETVIEGEQFCSQRKNLSPIIYIGKEYTPEEVIKCFQCSQTEFISKMKRNNWKRIVLTEQHILRPIGENDIVISD